jgi:hypothetical protein
MSSKTDTEEKITFAFGRVIRTVRSHSQCLMQIYNTDTRGEYGVYLYFVLFVQCHIICFMLICVFEFLHSTPLHLLCYIYNSIFYYVYQLLQGTQELPLGSEKFDFESDDPNATPYHLQGDERFNSNENLKRREALKRHVLVKKQIQRMWKLLDDNGMGSISRKKYSQFYLRVSKILQPSLRYEDAVKVVRNDFMQDTKGETRLSYMLFFDSLFQVADIWTADISGKSYATFLDKLFRRMTVKITRAESGSETRQLPAERVRKEVIAVDALRRRRSIDMPTATATTDVDLDRSDLVDAILLETKSQSQVFAVSQSTHDGSIHTPPPATAVPTNSNSLSQSPVPAGDQTEAQSASLATAAPYQSAIPITQDSAPAVQNSVSEQSVVPAAQSSTQAAPAALSSAPAAQSSAPAAQSSAPAAQSSAPAAQSSAPAAQSSAPAAQSSAPAAQSSAPVAQSSAPAAQSSAPVAQSSAPAAQSSAPAAQSSAPAAQSSAPAAQSSAPAAQSSAPAAQSSAPAAQSSAPAAQSSAPAAQSSAPAAQSSAPAAQSSAPAAQSSAPAAQSSAPAVQSSVQVSATDQTSAPISSASAADQSSVSTNQAPNQSQIPNHESSTLESPALNTVVQAQPSTVSVEASIPLQADETVVSTPTENSSASLPSPSSPSLASLAGHQHGSAETADLKRGTGEHKFQVSVTSHEQDENSDLHSSSPSISSSIDQRAQSIASGLTVREDALQQERPVTAISYMSTVEDDSGNLLSVQPTEDDEDSSINPDVCTNKSIRYELATYEDTVPWEEDADDELQQGVDADIATAEKTQSTMLVNAISAPVSVTSDSHGSSTNSDLMSDQSQCSTTTRVKPSLPSTSPMGKSRGNSRGVAKSSQKKGATRSTRMRELANLRPTEPSIPQNVTNHGNRKRATSSKSSHHQLSSDFGPPSASEVAHPKVIISDSTTTSDNVASVHQLHTEEKSTAVVHTDLELAVTNSELGAAAAASLHNRAAATSSASIKDDTVDPIGEDSSSGTASLSATDISVSKDNPYAKMDILPGMQPRPVAYRTASSYQSGIAPSGKTLPIPVLGRPLSILNKPKYESWRTFRQRSVIAANALAATVQLNMSSESESDANVAVSNSLSTTAPIVLSSPTKTVSDNSASMAEEPRIATEAPPQKLKHLPVGSGRAAAAALAAVRMPSGVSDKSSTGENISSVPVFTPAQFAELSSAPLQSVALTNIGVVGAVSHQSNLENKRALPSWLQGASFKGASTNPRTRAVQQQREQKRMDGKTLSRSDSGPAAAAGASASKSTQNDTEPDNQFSFASAFSAAFTNRIEEMAATPRDVARIPPQLMQLLIRIMDTMEDFRPSYPGKTIGQSALQYIALSLKANTAPQGKFTDAKAAEKLDQFVQTCDKTAYLSHAYEQHAELGDRERALRNEAREFVHEFVKSNSGANTTKADVSSPTQDQINQLEAVYDHAFYKN